MNRWTEVAGRSASGGNGCRIKAGCGLGGEIDVPLNYADYYFLEALLRYRAVMTHKERLPFGGLR